MSGVYVIGFDRKFSGDKHTDYVHIANRNNMSAHGRPVCTTWFRVNDINADGINPASGSVASVDKKRKEMCVIWDVVKPAYDAWLSGNEIPDNGTPLAAWGGLTAEQASALRAAGFRTVEDVAAATDDRIAGVRLSGSRKLKVAAQEWLDGRSAASMAAEIAELRALLAKAGMQDKYETDAEVETAPKRRGRPPKAEREGVL